MPEKIYELEKLCLSVLTEAKDEDKNKDTESDSPFGGSTDDSDDADDTKDTSDKTDDADDSDVTDDSSESDGDSADDSGETTMFGQSAEDESDDDETGDNASDEVDNDEGDVVDDESDAGSEMSAEGFSDVQNFGIMLLMLGTQVHFWHINCHTSGEHECLADLYDELEDGADKLLENIVSKTKSSVIAGNELSFDFGTLEFDKDEVIGILEDARDEAESMVKQYSDDEGLGNILTDISEKLSVAIYKLSRFGD